MISKKKKFKRVKHNTALSRLELRSPPLPQTLLEAMNLLNQPDQLEVGPVTEMVQRDPIVIARLLQIVNSAYYGLHRSVGSADRAVVMLGPVAVTGIVMGMNMLKLRSALEGPASRAFLRVIRHSIATAFLTRFIIEGPPKSYTQYSRRQLGRIGVSFTAGLLHDFGKITLIYNFPRQAAELYDPEVGRRHVSEANSMQELEQLFFGYDHAEAGAYVARKLGFPEDLVHVIRQHHLETPATEDPEVDRLILATGAANCVAKAIGYSSYEPLGWDECLADPIWEKLFTNGVTQHRSLNQFVERLEDLKPHLKQYVDSLTEATINNAKNASDDPTSYHHL